MEQNPYPSPPNHGANPVYPHDVSYSDPMQNLSAYGGNNQMFQLRLDSLMPAGWNSSDEKRNNTQHPRVEDDAGNGDSDSDWYRYAPNKQAVDRYISSSGSSRFSSFTRNSNARLFGMTNLLRSNPPVPLSSGEITFNNSENRQGLIDSLTRNGCL